MPYADVDCFNFDFKQQGIFNLYATGMGQAQTAPYGSLILVFTVYTVYTTADNEVD